jgi:hypothetical protein
MSGKNTLAYYSEASMTKKKMVSNIVPDLLYRRIQPGANIK